MGEWEGPEGQRGGSDGQIASGHGGNTVSTTHILNFLYRAKPCRCPVNHQACETLSHSLLQRR